MLETLSFSTTLDREMAMVCPQNICPPKMSLATLQTTFVSSLSPLASLLLPLLAVRRAENLQICHK